jgi:hypothetical protein
MPHPLAAHHETSKHDSPNQTKVKEKQNETVPNSNSNIVKSITYHNQNNELTTWFLSGIVHAERRIGGKLRLYRSTSRVCLKRWELARMPVSMMEVRIRGCAGKALYPIYSWSSNCYNNIYNLLRIVNHMCTANHIFRDRVVLRIPYEYLPLVQSWAKEFHFMAYDTAHR